MLNPHSFFPLDLLGQPNFPFIGFRSHTNQKNGSPLVRIYDFIRSEEMVYTLHVMAPIFSFVVLVQLPKCGHDSRRLPFLCLSCSGRPYTFLVAKNVVYRATTQLKYSHGTQRVNKHMVRTAEQHDRGHVTPNKVPGPRSVPVLIDHGQRLWAKLAHTKIVDFLQVIFNIIIQNPQTSNAASQNNKQRQHQKKTQNLRAREKLVGGGICPKRKHVILT